MELTKRIILPCGNAAILDERANNYRCNFCHYIIGSSEEPSDCKRKREDAEPVNKDYWMNIDDGPDQI